MSKEHIVFLNRSTMRERTDRMNVIHLRKLKENKLSDLNVRGVMND